MAIDFPASPTNGQTFTSGSVTYTYDGTKWTALASGGSSQWTTSGSNIYYNTGSVAIGATSPGVALHVEAASGEAIRASASGANQSIWSRFTGGSPNVADLRVGVDSAAGGTYGVGSGGVVWNAGNGPLAFGTSNTQRAQIDASGRLLVGTSTARSNIYLGGGNDIPKFQVEGSGSNYSTSLSLIHYSSLGTCPAVNIGLSLSDTPGTNAAVGSGNEYGIINFVGNDGTNFRSGAQIKAAADGGVSTADLPTRLVFTTTPDGSASPVERMRITSAGRVLINTDTATATPLLGITGSLTANNGLVIKNSVAHSGSPNFVYFLNNADGVSGAIVQSGSTSVSYNTSSDYRLKENVIPLTGAIDRLQQIPVHRFNFIADPDKTVDGFIAHEAQEVVPECVTGEKDAVDDDGNPVYQGIDQSKLVPLLTAALQEALQKIEELEGRLTAAGL
jgi:hypothetical protein